MSCSCLYLKLNYYTLTVLFAFRILAANTLFIDAPFPSVDWHVSMKLQTGVLVCNHKHAVRDYKQHQVATTSQAVLHQLLYIQCYAQLWLQYAFVLF